LWDVGGDHLSAGRRSHINTTQIDQNGDPYTCLKQLGVNLNTD
jgi:hypothetical protein